MNYSDPSKWHDLMDVRRSLWLALPRNARQLAEALNLPQDDVETHLKTLETDGQAYSVTGVGWFRRMPG